MCLSFCQNLLKIFSINHDHEITTYFVPNWNSIIQYITSLPYSILCSFWCCLCHVDVPGLYAWMQWLGLSYHAARPPEQTIKMTSFYFGVNFLNTIHYSAKKIVKRYFDSVISMTFRKSSLSPVNHLNKFKDYFVLHLNTFWLSHKHSRVLPIRWTTIIVISVCWAILRAVGCWSIVMGTNRLPST